MSEQTTIRRSRAEQARINGARSRGPLAPKTKLRSSRNGLVHGVYANHAVLLDNEDADAFEALLASYQRRFSPADPFEHNLVRELCTIDWTLIRARTAQANLINLAMARQAFGPDAPALCRTEPQRLTNAYREVADSSRAFQFSQTQIDRIIRTRTETIDALSKSRCNFPIPERTQDTHIFQQLDLSLEPAVTPENPPGTQPAAVSAPTLPIAEAA